MSLISLLSHPYTVTVARWILAPIFLASGLSKLPNQRRFVFIVLAYKVLPQHLAYLYAAALPWVEVVVGLMLLLGIATRIGAALAGLLLLSFALAVMLNIMRRRTSLDCGCFGNRHKQRLGGKVLARNGALLLLSIDVMLFAQPYLALDSQLLAVFSSGQQVVALTGLLSIILAIAVVAMCFPLLKQANLVPRLRSEQDAPDGAERSTKNCRCRRPKRLVPCGKLGEDEFLTLSNHRAPVSRSK